MRLSHRIVVLFALAALPFSRAAKADSIAPATFTATLATGESVTVHKVVTVDTVPPENAPVDVFLLSDTTGSMGGFITSVRTSALSIVASTSGLGNVQFGVGEYKDVGDAFVYRTNTNLSGVAATIQTGINQWVAGGGGDLPEANLYGLDQVANTISWRPGSTRILIWFGDAPGHDPSAGVTEAIATSDLVAKGIAVQALDVGSLNSSGQALRIANATGGHYYSGVNTGSIVSTITSSISTTILTYTSVNLDLSGVPAGLSATSTPGFVGSWGRDVSRDFAFDLTFTGTAAGTYTFGVPALVDKAVVAKETDVIKVTGPETPPSCALTAVIAGPPKQLQISVQDADNGIQSIEVTDATNATIELPTFTPGDKDLHIVVATKTDESLGALVALRVTDTNGAVIDCDPVLPGDAENMDLDGSPNAGGAACSIGHGRTGELAGLLGGALAGLALLRRRRNSGRKQLGA
jgi:hypothetical protein